MYDIDRIDTTNTPSPRRRYAEYNYMILILFSEVCPARV